MKYLIVVGLILTGLVTLLATPQAGSDARAWDLIRTLKLTVLPKESGYLGITPWATPQELRELIGPNFTAQ